MEFGQEFRRAPGLAGGEIGFLAGILGEFEKFCGSGFKELDELPVTTEYRAARPAAADVTGEVPEHIPAGGCAFTFCDRDKAVAIQRDPLGRLHAGEIQHGRIPIHTQRGNRRVLAGWDAGPLKDRGNAEAALIESALAAAQGGHILAGAAVVGGENDIGVL